jgi:hypothetical protein
MPPKKKVAQKSTNRSVATASGDDLVLSSDVELMSYPELLVRKRQIDERLDDISVPDVLKKRTKYSGGSGKGITLASPVTSPDKKSHTVVNDGVISYTSKTDTHWDFVVKGRNDNSMLLSDR